MNVFAEDYSIQHKTVHRSNTPPLAWQPREEAKGRFDLFDSDSVLSPEKELGEAVGVNRHLRDQQAPCLFIPNVHGTSLTTEVLHISVKRFSIVFCKFC